MVNWLPQNDAEIFECAKVFVAASEKERQQLLASSYPLFVHSSRTPQNILGPTLDEYGKVIADSMATEMNAFSSVATDLQYRFFSALVELHESFATEFALTISNSLKIWKDDVRWLRAALVYLKKGDKQIAAEQDLLKAKDHVLHSRMIPEVLRRHFPQIFKEHDIEAVVLSDVIRKIKHIDEIDIAEEKYLTEYLENLQAKYPFLFEK